ncbi:MAG: hypothetical protein KJ556_21870 [Gammaproteobacteria bacterium]|nr:hypothetical protein [Gammaproteobacteria bacterium]
MGLQNIKEVRHMCDDIRAGEAWTANVKSLFDVFLQDWSARTAADRELRTKMESLFLGKTQDLDQVKLEAARTAQIHNAVINAALTESVLGSTLEQTIEGKLAAQFPASVTEAVTLITDKLVNMVGVDALLAIVEAVVGGKSDIEV